jgi:cell division transport system permease protein
MAVIQQKSKNLGSYPYASVILGTTVALIALGGLSMLIIAILNFADMVKENVEVQIMLDNGLEQEEIDKIKQTIASKPYVKLLNGKPDIIFKHKDEAAKELIKFTRRFHRIAWREPFAKFLSHSRKIQLPFTGAT